MTRPASDAATTREVRWPPRNRRDIIRAARGAKAGRRNVVVWIWGRGYRVSRLRLIRAALSPGDLYLHRWGKP